MTILSCKKLKNIYARDTPYPHAKGKTDGYVNIEGHIGKIETCDSFVKLNCEFKILNLDYSTVSFAKKIYRKALRVHFYYTLISKNYIPLFINITTLRIDGNYYTKFYKIVSERVYKLDLHINNDINKMINDYVFKNGNGL